MKERSLVAFTLLSQMAVGVFWVLVILRWVATRYPGAEGTGKLMGTALWLVSLLMLVGLAAAFFHLGAPFRAWRALANLRSSWLSREALFALLFSGATVLVAGLHRIGWGTASLRGVLSWAASILGLALLVSMANAYRLRTVPAWHSWATPVTFVVTALLLGVLVVGALLGGGVNVLPEAVQQAQQALALGAILLLGVSMFVTLQWIARMWAAGGAASRAATRIAREHGFLFRLRLALVAVAVVLCGAVLIPWKEVGCPRILMILSFTLVLASEVMGRLLFYEARVRHGV